jgi:hypothetical protein
MSTVTTAGASMLYVIDTRLEAPWDTCTLLTVATSAEAATAVAAHAIARLNFMIVPFPITCVFVAVKWLPHLSTDTYRQTWAERIKRPVQQCFHQRPTPAVERFFERRFHTALRNGIQGVKHTLSRRGCRRQRTRHGTSMYESVQIHIAKCSAQQGNRRNGKCNHLMAKRLSRSWYTS